MSSFSFLLKTPILNYLNEKGNIYIHDELTFFVIGLNDCLLLKVICLDDYMLNLKL